MRPCFCLSLLLHVMRCLSLLVQCRGYGLPESEEPAAREAAFAMARLEQRMAKKYREKILACGADIVSARKVFEDMVEVSSCIAFVVTCQLERQSGGLDSLCFEGGD